MPAINEGIHILLSFDDHYVAQATVTMNSVMDNNKDEVIRFHVFHKNLGDSTISTITRWVHENSADIYFYKFEERDYQIFRKLLKPKDQVSIETFFRLLGARFLPDEVTKVLYIDCDAVNLSPLRPLWDIDISKYALAAVVGHCSHKHKKYLGLAPDDLYFQAGVLLLNIDFWRNSGAVDTLLDYAKNSKYLPRWDQDILNSVFKWQWLRIPLKYNVPNQILQIDPGFATSSTSFARQFSTQERLEAINSPVILHFTGFKEYKPWVKGIKLVNREKYLKYSEGIPLPHKMTSMPRLFFLRQYRATVVNRLKSTITRLSTTLLYWQKRILVQTSPSYRNQIEIIKKLDSLSGFNNPLMRNIQKRLNAALMHQTVFPKYKNIHQGRDIVLVATGATAKYYHPLEGAVHIGVNRAFMLPGVKLDYLFVADYAAHIGGSACSAEYLYQLDDYRHEGLKIFYGILDDDIQPNWVIPESLALKHKVERYYALSAWKYRPFKGVLQLDAEMLSDNGSISFPAFQFALFTNPKRIFLVGCDSGLTGYFDSQSQPYSYDHSHIIYGWKQMKKFALTHYPDTEIISINPVNLKGMFTDIFTDDFVKPILKGE